MESTKKQRTVLHLSAELLAAIDQARGDAPRAGWVEQVMWRSGAIRDAAAEIGVENPRLPTDMRGRWIRTSPPAE